MSKSDDDFILSNKIVFIFYDASVGQISRKRLWEKLLPIALDA
jgi:hypothetical protein